MSGWDTTTISGDTATWAQTGSGPTDPHGGTYMMYFNSYDAVEDESARVFRTSGFIISGSLDTTVLTFWMYHFPGSYSGPDNIQVQISTDGGSNWQNVGDPIMREDGTEQWTQHTINLAGITGSLDDVRVGFLGTSGYGDDMFIDDVVVSQP